MPIKHSRYLFPEFNQRIHLTAGCLHRQVNQKMTWRKTHSQVTSTCSGSSTWPALWRALQQRMQSRCRHSPSPRSCQPAGEGHICKPRKPPEGGQCPGRERGEKAGQRGVPHRLASASQSYGPWWRPSYSRAQRPPGPPLVGLLRRKGSTKIGHFSQCST